MPDASRIELNLNALYFRLAHLFITEEDTRYYLRGVHCEPHPSGEGALMAATNGHVMAAFYDREGKVPKPADKTTPGYIIRAQNAYLQAVRPIPEPEPFGDYDVEWPLLDAGKNQRLEIVITGKSVSMSCEGWSAPGELIDCDYYPDWRKAFTPGYETGLEKEPEGKPERGFGPHLLQPFVEVAQMLPCRQHGRYIHMVQGGLNGPARITTDCPDFCGVIMPLACPVRESMDWLGTSTQPTPPGHGGTEGE